MDRWHLMVQITPFLLWQIKKLVGSLPLNFGQKVLEMLGRTLLSLKRSTPQIAACSIFTCLGATTTFILTQVTKQAMTASTKRQRLLNSTTPGHIGLLSRIRRVGKCSFTKMVNFGIQVPTRTVKWAISTAWPSGLPITKTLVGKEILMNCAFLTRPSRQIPF